MADNSDLGKLAIDALQAVEKLHLNLRPKKSEYSDKCTSDVTDVLDKLRYIKSEIEGSHHNFIPMSLNEDPLQELRQLVLMHIPSSLTSQVKERFNSLVSKVMEGHCKKIVSVTLLTCPWYSAVQRERGEQARYNNLFIVYLSHDDHFFAPVDPHEREKNDVVDLNWLYATEMFHFGSFLVKGKPRCLEVMFCDPAATIYESPEWTALRENLNHKQIMGIRGFIEACRGQAIGSISKKNKLGNMRLRENTTFYNLCESCRLLQHYLNCSTGKAPATEQLIIDLLPDIAMTIAQRLKDLYLDPDIQKQDIFDLIIKWRDETNTVMKTFKFLEPSVLYGIVGKWMADCRLHNRDVSPNAVVEDEVSHLKQLMENIGPPVSTMAPEQIVLIARAGSYLYGLSTPESDVDYVIIYSEPTMNILSSCTKIVESRESRGPEKSFEYGAYEARIFSAMILRSSVVMLELLFADGLDYMSPAWKKFVVDKKRFVTENAMQQYQGLIKNNFHTIESKKHIGTRRDKKLFYQIFHKLDSLSYMLRGEPPPVRCEGSVRDYIMRIRTEPLEGDLERSKLYEKAKEDYHRFCVDHADGMTRLPENQDYRFIADWLLTLRNIGSAEQS